MQNSFIGLSCKHLLQMLPRNCKYVVCIHTYIKHIHICMTTHGHLCVHTHTHTHAYIFMYVISTIHHLAPPSFREALRCTRKSMQRTPVCSWPRRGQTPCVLRVRSRGSDRPSSRRRPPAPSAAVQLHGPAAFKTVVSK